MLREWTTVLQLPDRVIADTWPSYGTSRVGP